MTALRTPPSPATIATDRWTAPYWAAARERRLVVCECAACATLRMPPGPFCPQCQSSEVRWREVPGSGSIYSYSVVRRAVAPEMEDCVPYAPAVVELDRAPGIRLVTAIVESQVEALAVGARVTLVWQALASGELLPRFRLAHTLHGGSP